MLNGYADKVDNFTIYQESVRYVKVLGYTKVESGSGIGINELSVYEYVNGDSKENETIEKLLEREIINNANGKGSYVSGEMYNEKNKLPTFINEESIQTPIDSNSWWSSAMVQNFSNLLCSTPLKAGFSMKGLGILTATSGWVGTRTENDLGTDQKTEEGTIFKVMTAAPSYRIKVTFPSKKENYMSVAAMTKKGDIDTYYKHGYAFVTDTQVDYTYNQENSKIETYYTATTKVMREGFSDVSMHALFPHQWKHSTDANSPDAIYTSIRGDMKAIWSNTFKPMQQSAIIILHMVTSCMVRQFLQHMTSSF